MTTKKLETCNHEWQVTSTALQDVCLIVRCVKCDEVGTVDDPTENEWCDAFHSPSNPYKWMDNSRVVVRPDFPMPLPVNDILHGDCVDVMASLPDECVDLIFNARSSSLVRNIFVRSYHAAHNGDLRSSVMLFPFVKTILVFLLYAKSFVR
jgi:hypothetical protein